MERKQLPSRKRERCKCSLRHCFTSQDTWWSGRNSSGQTVMGSLNVWFPWSKTIIYLMGIGKWWCMNPTPSIAAEDLTFMRCVKKAVVLEVNLYKDIIGTVLKITKSTYSKNPALVCWTYFQEWCCRSKITERQTGKNREIGDS